MPVADKQLKVKTDKGFFFFLRHLQIIVAVKTDVLVPRRLFFVYNVYVKKVSLLSNKLASITLKAKHK